MDPFAMGWITQNVCGTTLRFFEGQKNGPGGNNRTQTTSLDQTTTTSDSTTGTEVGKATSSDTDTATGTGAPTSTDTGGGNLIAPTSTPTGDKKGNGSAAMKHMGPSAVMFALMAGVMALL